MTSNKFILNGLPKVTDGVKISFSSFFGNENDAIKITFPSEGGMIFFKGLPGKIGGVEWNEEKYLIVPIYHEENHSIFVHLRFWEGEMAIDLPNSDVGITVLPYVTAQIIHPIEALNFNSISIPRTPGCLRSILTGTPTDASKITCLAIEIPRSLNSTTIILGIPSIAFIEPKCDVPVLNMVDELGQWTKKVWIGKTKCIKEMTKRLNSYLNMKFESNSILLDEYGGWTEQKYNATGFFRTEHDGKRWWIIDPLGHPFFSVGPNCVQPSGFCPVNGIENFFSWIPSKEGLYKDAWYFEEGLDMFSYEVANLIRAFGHNWKEKWREIVAKLIKNWGFNTISSWSDIEITKHHKTPYIYELKTFPSTENCIFRDFPDVFSTEYINNAQICVNELKTIRDDPYLIGYVLKTEPAWSFEPYNIAEFLLANPKKLYSKQKLIEFLVNRYNNNVDELSQAWGRNFKSFDELYEPIKNAANLSKTANLDLCEFTMILIDEYIRVPSLAAKKVDSNHMNLGLRRTWDTSDFMLAGSQYCDIYSINHYLLQPDKEEIRKISMRSGRPVFIGEFHSGTIDSGLTSNGVIGVLNRFERGVFYRWYIEQALIIPEVVGANYFQWSDEPVLGRFDGENCNIGLVDVCHKPYYELVEAAKKTHKTLYQVRMGEISPINRKPIEVPREGFC